MSAKTVTPAAPMVFLINTPEPNTIRAAAPAPAPSPGTASASFKRPERPTLSA